MRSKLLFVFVAGLFATLSSHLAYAQRKSEVVEVPFMFERSSVIVQVKVNGKIEKP